MYAAKWGRIVNVASVAGLKGYAYVTAYCASKHGMIGMTRALAQETAKHGVTVNAVCPGYVETDIVTDSRRAKHSREDQAHETSSPRLALCRFNPQGRLISHTKSPAPLRGSAATAPQQPMARRSRCTGGEI